MIYTYLKYQGKTLWKSYYILKNMKERRVHNTQVLSVDGNQGEGDSIKKG
jgi:hypothetical protein